MKDDELVFKDPAFVASNEVSTNIDPAARLKYLTPNTEFPLSPSEFRAEINKNVKAEISYIMNNYVHRCDDFYELDQSKYNVLFAGNSATFGEGLPRDYVWDYMVYEKLKEEIPNIGPFHSMGFIGGDITKIVYNIFKYINKFGLPSEIFFCISNYAREVRYFESISGFKTQRWDEEDLETMIDGARQQLIYLGVVSIRNLMVFCKINNIKLNLFGFHVPTSRFIHDIIPELFVFPDDSVSPERVQDTGEYDLSQYDPELKIWARDNNHAGIISNLNIVNILMDLRKAT